MHRVRDSFVRIQRWAPDAAAVALSRSPRMLCSAHTYAEFVTHLCVYRIRRSVMYMPRVRDTFINVQWWAPDSAAVALSRNPYLRGRMLPQPVCAVVCRVWESRLGGACRVWESRVRGVCRVWKSRVRGVCRVCEKFAMTMIIILIITIKENNGVFASGNLFVLFPLWLTLCVEYQTLRMSHELYTYVNE